MKRNIKKADVVWHTAPNATETDYSMHGYYSKPMISEVGTYTGETHQGNAALCNGKFGISEDGDSYLSIDKLKAHELNPNFACKRCQKIFNNLP